MKTLIRLLLSTAVLSLAFTAAQAADNKIAARYEAALAKMQKANVITADTADYFRKNVSEDKGVKCDSARLAELVTGVVKNKGGNPANLDETIKFIAENKMVGDSESLKRNLTAKTTSGSYAVAIITRLAATIK